MRKFTIKAGDHLICTMNGFVEFEKDQVYIVDAVFNSIYNSQRCAQFKNIRYSLDVYCIDRCFRKLSKEELALHESLDHNTFQTLQNL